MKNISFKFPGKVESIGIMVMLFSLFAIFQASHLYLSVGLNWTTNFSGSIPLPGALMFWIFFILFHFSTMFVTARSILIKGKGNTWNGYDFAVGFLMIFGLYLIVISTLYGVYRGTPGIEFLWNAKYIILLNIGFAIETVGMLWFAITE